MNGTWYARFSEFLHHGIMQTLRWMRIPGDSLFAFGALVLTWFVVGLVTGHSFDKSAGRSFHASAREVRRSRGKRTRPRRLTVLLVRGKWPRLSSAGAILLEFRASSGLENSLNCYRAP